MISKCAGTSTGGCVAVWAIRGLFFFSLIFTLGALWADQLSIHEQSSGGLTVTDTCGYRILSRLTENDKGLDSKDFGTYEEICEALKKLPELAENRRLRGAAEFD